MKKLNNKGVVFFGFLGLVAASIAVGELCVAYGNCTRPAVIQDQGPTSEAYSSTDLHLGGTP